MRIAGCGEQKGKKDKYWDTQNQSKAPINQGLETERMTQGGKLKSRQWTKKKKRKGG